MFSEYGGKLEVDNVVKVRGRVNARDKDGNVTSDVKLLAESVELISDEILEAYKSTGTKLAAPVVAASRKKYGRASVEKVYGNGVKGKAGAVSDEAPRVLKEPPKDHRKERLYLLIEDPEDVNTLTEIRKLASLNVGFQEVVLVMKDGEDKRPLKMPFKVDATDDLLSKLRELLGDEKVKVG